MATRFARLPPSRARARCVRVYSLARMPNSPTSKTATPRCAGGTTTNP
jgi:hypothetical protein